MQALVRIGVYLLAFFLLFLSYWINRYFGTPDLEQIAYHLSFGADGLAASDPVFIRRFVRWCVIAPILFVVLAIVAERSRAVHRLGKGGNLRRRVAALLAPRVAALPYLLLLVAAVYWTVQVSAFQYLFHKLGPDYFSSHYVFPGTVKLRETKPKNLVLIYVESLESSYSNKALFGKDMLSSLSQLEGASFAGFRQAPGTGWTIAGMVATQCGVPLKRVTVYDENTQGEVLKSFLPNATCLSDILAEHRYRNVFMGGGSPSFAGKGKFLRSHHYHEVYGEEDWLRQGVPHDAMNGWGLFDVDLFARARRKLQDLENTKRPFSLTLLTVDTHEPRGYLSRHCAERGYAGFEGVVQCTADEVAEFVRFIKTNGYLANTNVVIVGDHLARKNPLTDKLSTLPERHIFNAFISSQSLQKNREDIVHFDLLPTMLEFVGFEVRGGRLGLGYSAFNHPADIPPSARYDEMQHSLLNRSDTYLGLWQPSLSPVPNR